MAFLKQPSQHRLAFSNSRVCPLVFEMQPKRFNKIQYHLAIARPVSSNLSSSFHYEKLAQKAFAALQMIRRTFSRRTKDVTLVERVQRAATKVVAGLKSVDYRTRLAVLDLFPWAWQTAFSPLTLQTRRGHSKIFKLRAHTFIRQNFSSFRVVAAWNDLPRTVVRAPSRNQFKALLDIYLGESSR
ncbi:hypothetical protein T265_00483 [Opisthorchis viverrini]|uniref:Uncharacterized protein n=1 Tax=Opisthorchis viverrini TaxID=6198 RepID=A0A075ACG8_OPIVI|nr:hypothetical protein T265_00483 [Opisthorchis viverrini]KER33585.1 hypothetical protein T265_00483 [Opisthorchis viverrini]